MYNKIHLSKSTIVNTDKFTSLNEDNINLFEKNIKNIS